MRAKLEDNEIMILGQEKCCSTGAWDISAEKATIYGDRLIGNPGAKIQWISRFCYLHVDEAVELLRNQFKGEYMFTVTMKTPGTYPNYR